MQINLATDSRVSLINSGYWGIAVKKDAKYLLRFYLRASSDYTGDVNAKIISADNKVLAESVFAVKADGEWHEYKAKLNVSATDPKTTFALEFNLQGTVFVDYVSLFPEKTFMNRPNGLRIDAAQLLADLHPAFLRWPGGCTVNGITRNSRVKWKETLGDPMSRPGEYTPWNYRNSYGFGYHEFLQFCEDIGLKGCLYAAMV